MADMMYFMNQNKKKEATKQKEREEKAKLKDVNMAAPSFDRKILNDQHQREKDAKAKERAQPKENAKFDMAVSLMFVKKYEKTMPSQSKNFIMNSNGELDIISTESEKRQQY